MIETLAARLEVRIDAIAANYRLLAKRAAPGRCGAVLKADAYGLGAGPIAAALYDAGCRDFFVVLLQEAAARRQALPHKDAKIYVLNGVAGAEVASCSELEAIPVHNTLTQCRTWVAMGGGVCALQVDTGMSRLGLSPADQDVLRADRVLMDSLDLALLITHFAAADAPDHAANQQQLEAFAAARRRFPGVPGSLENSAAMFLPPAFRGDVCRPGAALMGIDTGPATTGMRPVLRLQAPVLQLRDVPAGTGIGYGHTAIAERPMRLATIGLGYADGWPRALSGKGMVHWQGSALPMVGRVSMDSFVVDASGPLAQPIHEGALVDLIGPHQSVDDVARTAGTIGYEILTMLGSRFSRTYIDGSLQS